MQHVPWTDGTPSVRAVPAAHTGAQARAAPPAPALQRCSSWTEGHCSAKPQDTSVTVSVPKPTAKPPDSRLRGPPQRPRGSRFFPGMSPRGVLPLSAQVCATRVLGAPPPTAHLRHAACPPSGLSRGCWWSVPTRDLSHRWAPWETDEPTQHTQACEGDAGTAGRAMLRRAGWVPDADPHTARTPAQQ